MPTPVLDLTAGYKMLLDELLTHRLQVTLVPSQIESIANDGRMIRVAFETNPEWYQRLCAEHAVPSNRKKPRTTVGRRDIERLLLRLSQGHTTRSKYFEALKNEAEAAIEKYNIIEPWDNQF